MEKTVSLMDLGNILLEPNRVFEQLGQSEPDPTRVFFGLTLWLILLPPFFTFIGTLAQDALLEPYGGLVLGMSVGDTTRLTMFWGVGVLISMLLSGLFLIKWLGFMKLMRTGIILSIAVFVGLIIVGMMGNASAFKSLVFVMGLGTGLAGAGMLSHSTVISAGTPVSVGDSVSRTVMICFWLVALPQLSVAVQVRSSW